MDVEAIAAQRDLKPTTVYGHMARAIERGEVPLTEVVNLQEHELDAIRFAIEHHEGAKRLKPVFDALDGAYPYEVLRCVRAEMMALNA